MERPSYKELNLKLRQAKDHVSEKRILIINPAVIADDAIELGYLMKKLPDVLSEILIEIKPQNYIGRHPPEKSYEQKIQGLELFTFRWDSTTFGCEAYFKFTVNSNALYIVSLHQHRQR
jgi:hypothetical protein